VAWAVLACVVTLARASATFDEAALARPTYFARGAELVQLVDAAENARQAGQSYALKVEGAVRGFATLLSDPNAGDIGAQGRRALLASDVHDNRFALDSLREYARGKPVFFVGDLGKHRQPRGDDAARTALARLGDRVVAISGNHDSGRMMRALVRRGCHGARATRRPAPRRQPRRGERPGRRAARRRLRRPQRVARPPRGRSPAGLQLRRDVSTPKRPRGARAPSSCAGSTGSTRAPTWSSSIRTGSRSSWPARCRTVATSAP
jgi:hypothetical protein